MVEGKPFAPKGEEELKAEVLEDLGEEYEGNKEKVDKIVARRLKDEEFKVSLHADKKKHLEGKKVYEERMKKAGLDPETGEKLLPKGDEGGDTTPKNDMSLKDIRALQDVHDDDVDDVVEWAKFKKTTIAEAKKSPHIQSLLKTKEEERKTIEATSTGTTHKTNSKSSEENLLKKAEENKLAPEEMKEAAKAVIASTFK